MQNKNSAKCIRSPPNVRFMPQLQLSKSFECFCNGKQCVRDLVTVVFIMLKYYCYYPDILPQRQQNSKAVHLLIFNSDDSFLLALQRYVLMLCLYNFTLMREAECAGLDLGIKA